MFQKGFVLQRCHRRTVSGSSKNFSVISS